MPSHIKWLSPWLGHKIFSHVMPINREIIIPLSFYIKEAADIGQINSMESNEMAKSDLLTVNLRLVRGKYTMSIKTRKNRFRNSFVSSSRIRYKVHRSATWYQIKWLKLYWTDNKVSHYVSLKRLEISE